MLRTAFIAAALSAPLALAGPALAQQKMSWHTQQTEDAAALVFGVPETDQAVIFFMCKPGTDKVTVQTLIGSKGLQADAAASITLAAGGVKKSFAGKATANEETGAVDVEAEGTLADVKALAKASGALSVEVKGAKRSVATTGLAAEIGKFETACKPKS